MKKHLVPITRDKIAAETAKIEVELAGFGHDRRV